MEITPQVLFSPLFLGIILGLVFFLFLGLSAALMYHWKAYGMGSGFVKAAPAVYFSFSIFLIMAAVIAYLTTL